MKINRINIAHTFVLSCIGCFILFASLSCTKTPHYETGAKDIVQATSEGLKISSVIYTKKHAVSGQTIYLMKFVFLRNGQKKIYGFNEEEALILTRHQDAKVAELGTLIHSQIQQSREN